ncbi:MAG: 7-carboxy-7-deazaguanine synthase QueE [Candidatus Omnitrophota bacterium]|nr:7-carboxy-7-deazaguanine synthase QueE [Candidatus Omnitrophota bacterium]
MVAKISDLFESIQGEGIYQGVKQVFVRFYGCNLDYCRFCDTRLEYYHEYGIEELFNRILYYKQGFHSLCLTGGEPLLQADFLKEFLKLLKTQRLTTYLETNGTLADQLSGLIDQIDIIAMDLKLPSSTGLRSFWPEHRKFLEIASSKIVFLKIVICNSTRQEDIEQALKIITGFNLPLVLQPNYFEMNPGLVDKLKSFQEVCLRGLSDVRIIPQLHKIMGVK